MPPKKKAKLQQEVPSAPQPAVLSTSKDGKGSVLAQTDASLPHDEHSTIDLWTDEQEIALLKGMMNWKPVGSSRSL